MNAEDTRITTQSEAKRKQAPQMCVDDDDKCNLEKTSLVICTGQPIMQRAPNTYRRKGCFKTRSTPASTVTVKKAIIAFPLVLDADVVFACTMDKICMY